MSEQCFNALSSAVISSQVKDHKFKSSMTLTTLSSDELDLNKSINPTKILDRLKNIIKDDDPTLTM